jgi:hypothetical protein
VGSTTRSRSGPSTGPPREPSRRRGGVDVYLLPAVIGGGLGDIEEVLAAGRALARAGFGIRLYRRTDRPLPPSVDGPWDWPPIERCARLAPRSPAALTVAPAWGISAAPHRDEPFGRGGPWAIEVAEIERAYGPDATLHASLEEFARTLPPEAEARERFREGGVRSRSIAARARAAAASGETAAFRAAFARFRAFDRPNVLHLFATLERSSAFARSFRSAVQTGPLWPDRVRSTARRRPTGAHEWVWYASPASAEAIAPAVLEGIAAARAGVRLTVRTDRPWHPLPGERPVTVAVGPWPASTWRHRFGSADLRIVTGSRTLLEALEVGGPFLYFNGTLGSGAARRRHRPEKLRALLALARALGVPSDLRRDLADFGRGRRVAAVVARAARRAGGWRRFPHRWRPIGFPPPYDDAGRLLVEVARALARRPGDAAGVVAAVRSGRAFNRPAG